MHAWTCGLCAVSLAADARVGQEGYRRRGRRTEPEYSGVSRSLFKRLHMPVQAACFHSSLFWKTPGLVRRHTRTCTVVVAARCSCCTRANPSIGTGAASHGPSVVRGWQLANTSTLPDSLPSRPFHTHVSVMLKRFSGQAGSFGSL